MFSIIETKPDIAFSITVAACFVKNANHNYTEAVVNGQPSATNTIRLNRGGSSA